MDRNEVQNAADRGELAAQTHKQKADQLARVLERVMDRRWIVEKVLAAGSNFPHWGPKEIMTLCREIDAWALESADKSNQDRPST